MGQQHFTEKTFPLTVGTHRTGHRISQKKRSPRCQLRPTGSASILRTQKMNTPRLAGTHLGGRLTCGPTKLTGTKGFVNLVNMNDSSSSDRRCPSNGRSASSTSGLLAPAAQSSAGRAACSCLPWPAVLPWRPHHPLLFLGLAVVHRPGALRTAWSTWSRNDFQRKSTVGGEANS